MRNPPITVMLTLVEPRVSHVYISQKPFCVWLLLIFCRKYFGKSSEAFLLRVEAGLHLTTYCLLAWPLLETWPLPWNRLVHRSLVGATLRPPNSGLYLLSLVVGGQQLSLEIVREVGSDGRVYSWEHDLIVPADKAHSVTHWWWCVPTGCEI